MNPSQQTDGEGRPRYYGKYRGTVVNNIDPLKEGRIQVIVPDVSIIPSTWAMPCVPVAGLQMGMLAIPPMGAGVWVEFEQGNPDKPIWVGCWWGSAAEVPALAQSIQPPVQGLAFQTTLQTALVISDVPGVGIMLTTPSKASVTISDAGIFIQNGKGASISMVGPAITITGARVSINDPALVVS
jgi:hypothetical protein